MKKYILCISAFLLTITVCTVQAQNTLPDGWKTRFDSPSSTLSDVSFKYDNGVIHLNTGRAHAIFYRDSNVLNGDYQISATFTMDKNASPHGEAYGLFVGGRNLQEASQHYLYFLTRRDGKYLIKTRDGGSTKTVVGWSPTKDIMAEKGSQAQSNTLAIDVGSNDVSFWANGKKITSIPKSKLPDTDGIAGLRINHHLTMVIKNLEMKKGNQ
jgi:hypothetical protein